MMRPCHKFVDFVEERKHLLLGVILCQHPEYVRTIEAAPSFNLYWPYMSANDSPFVMAMLKEHPDRIDWDRLQANASPDVLHLLEAHMPRPTVSSCWGWCCGWHQKSLKSELNWREISANPAPWAARLRRKYPRELNWLHLCSNPAPDAVRLVTMPSNRRHLFWHALSENSSDEAVSMLAGNMDKISWQLASRNSNPRVIAWLRANPEQINWMFLSFNPAQEAIEMLRANPEKIDWYALSTNPGIFELDYAAMREQMRPLREELLYNRMHPSRVHQAKHDWLLI
jgi:hypothetical protein